MKNLPRARQGDGTPAWSSRKLGLTKPEAEVLRKAVQGGSVTEPEVFIEELHGCRRDP